LAIFQVVKKPYGAPPVVFMGYATSDGGQSWALVTPPPNAMMERFGGFWMDGQGTVQALYDGEAEAPDQAPAISVEQNVDGGMTWSSASLACPPSGTCIAGVPRQARSRAWARRYCSGFLSRPMTGKRGLPQGHPWSYASHPRANWWPFPAAKPPWFRAMQISRCVSCRRAVQPDRWRGCLPWPYCWRPPAIGCDCACAAIHYNVVTQAKKLTNVPQSHSDSRTMQQVAARVVNVGIYNVMPSFYRIRLSAPTLTDAMKPGQFLLVNTDAEYVRRPFFPIAVKHGDFDLVLPPDDPLRRLVPGDELDCIGPLGRGFPLSPAAHNLLFLAQHTGFGVSEKQNSVTFVLTLIDQALAAGKRALLIHEAPTAAQLFSPAGLPPGVEVRLITRDGSQGQAGTALDLLPELAQWADQVYAVGHPEWYRDLVRKLREHRLRLDEGLAWGLIAPAIMPCGTGVCGGCVVETRRGYRLGCSDGPVFDLTKV
jgi:dihydroorotate dehydrogenase electron transfer subunit